MSYFQEALQSILIIFAKLNPGIRYVQGMNEILAPLFYVFKNDPIEENAVSSCSQYLFNFVYIFSFQHAQLYGHIIFFCEINHARVLHLYIYIYLNRISWTMTTNKFLPCSNLCCPDNFLGSFNNFLAKKLVLWVLLVIKDFCYVSCILLMNKFLPCCKHCCSWINCIHKEQEGSIK